MPFVAHFQSFIRHKAKLLSEIKKITRGKEKTKCWRLHGPQKSTKANSSSDSPLCVYFSST